MMRRQNLHCAQTFSNESSGLRNQFSYMAWQLIDLPL